MSPIRAQSPHPAIHIREFGILDMSCSTLTPGTLGCRLLISSWYEEGSAGAGMGKYRVDLYVSVGYVIWVCMGQLWVSMGGGCMYGSLAVSSRLMGWSTTSR